MTPYTHRRTQDIIIKMKLKLRRCAPVACGMLHGGGGGGGVKGKLLVISSLHTKLSIQLLQERGRGTQELLKDEPKEECPKEAKAKEHVLVESQAAHRQQFRAGHVPIIHLIIFQDTDGRKRGS
ncbi:GL12266 [Drosophila persimilis]|uniref:GL12266 n=1 Tax=Drosophila persimilis TaxID=7234 RepID=B4GME2_DROPE|nr:GL12266 [Drosophila persimilis]